MSRGMIPTWIAGPVGLLLWLLAVGSVIGLPTLALWRIFTGG